MRLHVHGNGLALNRVVFIPVRSYPGAVARNRAKRILRESWRLLKDRFVSHGQDFVIVLYPGMDSYEERSAQLLRLLRQAGIVGAAR
jgi:ribonuclease P protein component